jgi:two-component system nitrogen regulation response regulator NtrX
MRETILIIDDEEGIRTSLAGVLEDEGYTVQLAADGEEGLAMAREEMPDLVLLDIWMPGMDGLEVLQRLKAIYPGLTVVMISGHGTIETAVKSTRMGAQDFIEKPLSLEKVLLTISNAMELGRLRQENDSLRGMIHPETELVGNSPAIASLREQIALVAASSAPVLISGESGAGKELAASLIHTGSDRSERPLIQINCAFIPEELLAVELFGHGGGSGPEDGATKGKCDLADGGTLFLDEVTGLSPALQARVLRFLQEGTFERVDGGRPVRVDIRIIAATSRSMEEAIRDGSFREDLFYRLNIIPLTLTPLRERRDDIPLLVDHFLEGFHRREGGVRKQMAPEAVEILANYDWPGNVRELRNIVERLVIMTPGTTITAAHMPDSLAANDTDRYEGGERDYGFLGMASLKEAREEFEREFILQKLEEHDWNVSRTAEAIELERSNLHRKIKSYGIELKK